MCLIRKKGYSTYSNNNTSNTLSSYTLLYAFSNNANSFTRKERQFAQEAKNLSKRFGSPSIRKFFQWLNKELILNTPITSQDVQRAKVTHGKEVVKL